MFTHIVKKHYVVIDATRRIVTDPRVFAATALVLLCATLWSYSQLRVWAHDDIPNLRTWADYVTGEVSTRDIYLVAEGRWLHELLRPLLEHVGGTVSVFANLALFFLLAQLANRMYAVFIVAVRHALGDACAASPMRWNRRR